MVLVARAVVLRQAVVVLKPAEGWPRSVVPEQPVVVRVAEREQPAARAVVFLFEEFPPEETRPLKTRRKKCRTAPQPSSLGGSLGIPSRLILSPQIRFGKLVLFLPGLWLSSRSVLA